MEDLLSRIEELERENVETTNVLYEILIQIKLIEEKINNISSNK